MTALNYRGQKWAAYPNLPKSKRNKAIEYSHTFHQADYGKLWWFVRERELTEAEVDAFSA